MAARSPYFETMFASGLKEAQQSVIELQYIDRFDVLNSLLEYLVFIYFILLFIIYYLFYHIYLFIFI